MFGTYRILLALAVVFVHYTLIAELSGLYAVFGFFMLSGYLMTLIMQESYGYSIGGISRFSFNRFLRIYPIYWFACLLSLGVLLLIADAFPFKTGNYFIPESPRQWLQNFGLVLKFSSAPQIIQPAWTLTIELFFYGCIGLGLSRTKGLTAMWLTGSIGYTAWMLVTGASDYDRFFTLGAASLPFAMGATLYHWRGPMAGWLSKMNATALLPAALFGLFVVNIALGHSYGVHRHIGLYANLLLCGLLLLSLHNRRELWPISRKADTVMGDLSYPIYLIHAPMGSLLLYLCKETGIPITGPSLLAFFVFLPPALLVAWLISISIEVRIEKMRARVKQKTRNENPL